MKLYTLTTIPEVAFAYPQPRCVGVFTDFAKAEVAVLNNTFDIYEHGSYKYAVVEEIESDFLYGGDFDAIHWYEWVGDVDTGKYQKCDCPEKYRNVVGFWG